jgi:hypothetical protein
MWSNRQVRGSPFKVTVSSGSTASKVVCSGEGLRGGIFGEAITASIDARRAGSGEFELFIDWIMSLVVYVNNRRCLIIICKTKLLKNILASTDLACR